MLNSCYKEKLKKIYIRPEVYDLFELVLENENIFTYRREHIDEHKKILNAISKQELYISKARKYFLDEKIDFDDFCKLKKEHNEILSQLNHQLNRVTQNLANCDFNNNLWPDLDFSVFRSYKEQDIKGKYDIVSLFTPTSINPARVNLNSLKIDEVLSLVIEYRE